MSAPRTYLDYNATAPLRPEARAAVVAAVDLIGNPSSVHAEGRRAQSVVESAREQVALLVNARPSEVVFTSGATEANATVVAAVWEAIAYADIEHDSVSRPAEASAARRVTLDVTRAGLVDPDGLAAALDDLSPRARVLVSLQLVNNETGVIQSVAASAASARAAGAATHTDAVQAAGRIAIDFAGLGVDYLTLSAHKLGGPKGIGALVVRDDAPLRSLIAGGGQERGRRAGTENVAGIAGFGAAAHVARLAMTADMTRIAGLRTQLEAAIAATTPAAMIIGKASPRIANTTCVAVPGVRAETMVMQFDLAGIAVSAGAACSSGKVGANRTLLAMGFAADIAQSAVRVSLGPETTQADIATFIEVWRKIAARRQRAA